MAEQKMVNVRYAHSGSEMATEFNGRQYCFSKQNGVMSIPKEVYLRVMKSRHVNAEHLELVYPDTTELEKQVERLSIEAERGATTIDEQAREIKLLKADNIKLRKKANK